ncbi:MAG: 30S ribosomal protein S3ae [Methanomassiliicoccales archaeon]|nr:30S ribosomal protein S3ae [Methanomassiliicoccales archaeon]
MPATKKTKTTTRKVKDRWRAKEWYKIHAPKMFNEMQIGETPSGDPSSLVGRTTEVTVHDLTGDFSKMHIKLKFKVNDVTGLDAHTVFVGQDLTSDYIRRLTRRKRTKTDHVVDARTKDGFLVRVKPMCVTEKRIQASQETAIRTIMTSHLHKTIADMSISDVVKSVISGDMAKDLSRSTKIIVPTKRIEIRRTEVLEIGTPLPDEKAIVEPQASEEEGSAQEVKPEEPSKQVVVEDVSEAGEIEASESVEGEELTKDKEE